MVTACHSSNTARQLARSALDTQVSRPPPPRPRSVPPCSLRTDAAQVQLGRVPVVPRPCTHHVRLRLRVCLAMPCSGMLLAVA
jgi:hypothetical protein